MENIDENTGGHHGCYEQFAAFFVEEALELN
jgi:hypothetical protein